MAAVACVASGIAVVEAPSTESFVVGRSVCLEDDRQRAAISCVEVAMGDLRGGFSALTEQVDGKKKKGVGPGSPTTEG